MSANQAAAESPCAHCPWRTENQGKPHPDGWYTTANRDRLWAKLRRGESMSCHPTDPTNPVSEKALAAGAIVAKEGATPRECAGALILQQREIMVYQDDPKGYAKARSRGLTKAGLRTIVERMILGPLSGDIMSKPDLNAEVSMDDLPWAKRSKELP